MNKPKKKKPRLPDGQQKSSSKKRKPNAKNSFLQFKGLLSGKGGDPLKALLKEKKWEIEHERKKWGI